MNQSHLSALFEPGAIAVVSDFEKKNAEAVQIIMHNLLNNAFKGVVLPVADHAASLHGVLTYPSIQSLPVQPDLGILCAAPQRALTLIPELAEKNARAIFYYYAHFSALPPDEQQEVSRALKKCTRKHGMKLLGPGCLGFVNLQAGINASLSMHRAQPGRMAFVTQSDSLFEMVMDWSGKNDISLSHCISIGSLSGVTLGDVLDFLAQDAFTRAILLYVDEIYNARRFLSAARATAAQKPVLVVRPNTVCCVTSEKLIDETRQHNSIHESVFRRAGLVHVPDIASLFEGAKTLSHFRQLRGDSLAILTNGRSPGLLAADVLKRGETLPVSFDEQTVLDLEDILGVGACADTPLVLPFDADAGLYERVIDRVLKIKGVGALLILHVPFLGTDSEELAQVIRKKARKTRKLLFASFMSSKAFETVSPIFKETEVAFFQSPDQAVRAFLHLLHYKTIQQVLRENPASVLGDFFPDVSRAEAVIATARAQGRRELTAQESRELANCYGLFVHKNTDKEAKYYETFVEVRHAGVFGPVIFFGQGDLSSSMDYYTALPPLNTNLAQDLIAQTNIFTLLQNGYKGRPAADIADLERFLVQVSQLIIDLPVIDSLEINPLLVNENGTEIGDIKIVLHHAETETISRLAIKPYPRHIEYKTTLKNGWETTIRAVHDEDHELILDLIRHVDKEDLRLRFFGSAVNFTLEDMHRFTQYDYEREIALVGETKIEGKKTVLGVLRAAIASDLSTAEFGTMVRSDLKRIGLASLLFRRMIIFLKESKVQYMKGQTFLDNTGMIGLAEHLGFIVEEDTENNLANLCLDLKHYKEK